MSCSISSISQVEIDQFKNEGWVLLKNLIPQKAIQEMRDLYASVSDDLVDRAFSEGVTKERFENVPFEKKMAQLPHDFMKIHGRSWRGVVAKAPVFRLQACEPLVEVMKELMGEELAGSEVFNARPKLPNQELTVVPWHQDAGYYGPLSVENEAYTTWIPLVPVSKENGCMQVIPGSDQRGYRSHANGVGEGEFKEIDDDIIKEEEIVTCDMEPGDVLIFNQLVYHRSLPNTTDGIRWSIDLRYYRLGYPPIQNRQAEENPWVVSSSKRPATTLEEWEAIVKEFSW
jgi:phytanoyl-CoA hydroxylase